MLKSTIINFLKDDSVINYLNEIHSYGLLLEKISKEQNLETKEIVIDNLELIAEYDYHREKIKNTFNSLRQSLIRYHLNKETFKAFCNTEGHVRVEFGHIADIINIVKFFVAIIYNQEDDKLAMTLGDRIENLKEMSVPEKQMLISELTCLKEYSGQLEERTLKI